MAQFRYGIFPLQIEVGRYWGVDLSLRTCPMCKNEVYDEIHFLCLCSAYDDFRNSLYHKTANCNSDLHNLDVFDKFVYLMSNQQRDVINFITKAVNMRKTVTTISK